MGNTQWTDEFLEKKRQEGDIWYDQYVRVILSVAFLDGDRKRIFADWMESQSRLLAETARIADALGGDLPDATAIDLRKRIDQLNVDQTKQYKALDAWNSHLWPFQYQFHIDSTRLATLMACKALANVAPHMASGALARSHLQTALSAMNCAQSNAALLESRYQSLLAQVAAQPDLKQQIGAENLAAYNRFLLISDAIRESPDIFLCEDAFRKAEFQSYPYNLNDNFTPGQCPSWGDGEKLRTGVRIWQEHMAGCVLVLFAYSLPACYLMKKGVPMLYRTERLGRQEFLAQRIYETGFMVKDVMDENGLSIISDTVAMRTAWFAAAVHKVRPDLTFQLGRYLNPEWMDAQGTIHTYWELLADPTIQLEYRIIEKQGPMTDHYSAADLGSPGFDQLFRHCLQDDVGLRGRRLWGRGCLSAAKVRYLHASMRYRALNDDPPYDVRENGVPINQEDQAYVLLTFGYLIPLGLEKLGAILTRKEKEAFLHSWKVIGYIMGIDDDLLTDDLDEAKELFEKIKNRQQARSEKGVKLTSALCTLITDLLPAWLPFRSAIAPVLIRDQMGADADDLFDAKNRAESRNPLVRGCWAFAKHFLLRGYFLSRHWFFDRIPSTRAGINSQVEFMATALVNSLQQTYERQRFDLFTQQVGIAANPDVTRAEHQKRAATRDRTLTWVAVGLLLIVLFHPLFWVGTASLVVSLFGSTSWFGPAANAVFWWMFWLCFVDVIGVVFVQRKVSECLKALVFDVPSKFLV